MQVYMSSCLLPMTSSLYAIYAGLHEFLSLADDIVIVCYLCRSTWVPVSRRWHRHWRSTHLAVHRWTHQSNAIGRWLGNPAGFPASRLLSAAVMWGRGQGRTCYIYGATWRRSQPRKYSAATLSSLGNNIYLRQIISSIDLFLSYRTDSTDSRTI